MQYSDISDDDSIPLNQEGAKHVVEILQTSDGSDIELLHASQEVEATAKV